MAHAEEMRPLVRGQGLKAADLVDQSAIAFCGERGRL
jgi:hypothetical protein